MAAPLGQIHEGTEFGAVLRQLAAARADLKSFVEVGTWNGRGSTACLMAGLASRADDDWSLLSLEIDPAQHAEALRHWAAAPRGLRLVLGRLGTRVMRPDEAAAHPLVQPPWRDWYADEIAHFQGAPVVALPPVVDFVLLDGGEFTTCGDWSAVQAGGLPRVVALDDTACLKCADIARQLAADPAWRLLASGDERNGWMVFERV
jgi:hypothetical protein